MKKLLQLAAFFAFGQVLSASVTVNWGNALIDPANNVDSDAVQIDSTYTADFGYFAGGAPTGDFSTWRSQFVLLDTSSYNQAAGFFSGVWNAPNNDHAGQQASIWIHNNDFSATPDTEWGIYTADDWVIDVIDDGKDFSSEFRISFAPETDELLPADTAIFGALPSSTGQGVQNEAFPTGGSFQTFTFVPEPSTVTLLGLSFISLIIQRKRK